MIVQNNLDRVRSHTADSVNCDIDSQIKRNIRFYATQSSQRISERIVQREKEWEVERVLETNASCLAFLGTMLGAFVNSWWLLLPGTVTAFLFLHAVQGWCPPLPILRRLGKRTRKEIDAEVFAMKALRGDFETLALSDHPSAYAERLIVAIQTMQ
jgi:hypothetical protein